MSDISFSIIIPVYNGEKTLRKAVESVACQSYRDKEILLLNDGSSDGTLQLAHELSSQYPCIKVFTHENRGLSATRNRGMEEATGDYLMFVDADDVLIEGALDSLAERLSTERYDVVYFDYDNVTHNKAHRKTLKGKTDGSIDNLYMIHHIYGSVDSGYSFVGLTVWSCCYSTEFIRRCHLQFDVEISMNEDALFNLYALRQATRLSYLSKSLYKYIADSSGSMTKGSCQIAEKHILGMAGVKHFADEYYPDDEYIGRMLLSWAWLYMTRITWMSALKVSLDEMLSNMKKIEDYPVFSYVLESHFPPNSYKYNPIFIIIFWAMKYKKYKLIHRFGHLFSKNFKFRKLKLAQL